MYNHRLSFMHHISYRFPFLRLLSKIPHRDVPPADKGTDLLLTLYHTPSTNTGFRGDKSLGRIRPRIGKRMATLRTCQAEDSIGSLTGAVSMKKYFTTHSLK